MLKQDGTRKSFIAPIIGVLLLSLLSSSLPFGTDCATVSATDSVFYDFIAQSPNASWSSGAGNLPFPGNDSDSRGFALYRDNWQLEDNTTWARVLETHPQWVSNGWIMGVYPEVTVPSNAELKVTVGFFTGATESDGVTFEVKFEEFLGLHVAPKIHSIISHRATYDGKLDSTVEKLSSLEGKTGNFVLYVNAGQSSGQDWAAWAEAKIEITTPPTLPDLVVESLEIGEGNKLSVTVKNIGTGPITAGWSASGQIWINGQNKGTFSLQNPTLNMNGGIPVGGGSSSYLLPWDILEPTLVACAVDIANDIEEANEQNNYKEEELVPPVVRLPDLVITEIEYDQEADIVSCTIKNDGDEKAPSSFVVSLSLSDPSVYEESEVEVNLKAGETYTLDFQISVQPVEQTVTIQVCADTLNEVQESNEQNNCLEDTFAVEAPPTPSLSITSGPSVSDITTTSATITWTTNLESDSRVSYDTHAGKFGANQTDTQFSPEHQISLEGLTPGTAYQFIAESEDEAGDTVRSRSLTFVTLPLPDKENPSVSLLVPDTLSGTTTICATAEDNIGVDRVVFFCDGKPMHTDFMAPFEWECDTSILDEDVHSFGAKVFDFADNIAHDDLDRVIQNKFPADLSPVRVEILAPEREAEVYGDSVSVSAKVTHDPDSRIRYIKFMLDGEIIWDKDYVEEFGHCVGTPLFEGTSFDFSGLELGGSHVIEVSAKDEHDNWGHAGIRVQIAEPEISVSRPEPIRHGNYFEVRLVIHNNSPVDVDELTISDTDMRFQCLSGGSVRASPSGGSWGPWVTMSDGEFEVTTSRSGIASTISSGNLGVLRSGEAIELRYYAVPVLLYDEGTYSFGQPLSLSYEAEGRRTTDYPPCNWILTSEETDDAFYHADYLIVTNTEKLFEHNTSADDVYELLATMAELAKEKNGVLGYLEYGAPVYLIRDRMEEGGRWQQKLGAFDYLLIVGETEIVPAPWIDCHVHFNGEGTCPICGATDVHAVTRIRITDFYYADIYRDDEIPDINVGRIIGETAEELITPIRASIDVYTHRAQCDCSDAYLISGYEGTWEMFIDKLDRETSWALFDEGFEVVHTMYNAEFYTTKHVLLREALAINGREPDEMKGEGATWEDYTVEELACWLLLREDRDVIMDQIPYQPDWYTDDKIIKGAEGYVSSDVLSQALDIAEEIQHDRRGHVYREYTYDNWSGENALSRIASTVKSHMSEKDLIIFAGHGGPGSWACVLDDWTTSSCPVEPIYFGSHRPIVLAFSCLTGNYKSEPGRSIARAFLRNGAAVYVGATEVAPCSHDDQILTQEFWRYWSTTSRIGDALFALKSWMIQQDNSWWRYVAYEYNLYGDPKFGGR